MTELSVFVDESGVQEGKSAFYLVTYVLHNQADDILDHFRCYEQSLKSKGLPNIPLHTSPLLQGHAAYENISLEMRKSLLMAFNMTVQKLPITYKTFVYKSHEFHDEKRLQTLIRRDLVDFLTDHLSYFQAFDHVNIYYDAGQPVVRGALEKAFSYVLAQEAIVRRSIDNRSFRLAQVADYLCAIELASAKYNSKTAGKTENKFFGTKRDFKRNWLKQAQRKQLV